MSQDTKPRPGFVETETLTVEQAAHMCGIGRQLAYHLARTGKLPGVRRFGTRLVVSRKVLQRYLDEEPP
ncbi:MAG: DNA-binding protein [Chloroflexi bacterium]|nr:DNA-binding protein [Chloroflexota bacterium]